MTDKFAISIPPQVPFALNPGDEITDCCGIWAAPDEFAAELSNCSACGRRAFRVVTVTSFAGLQKRWALCGKHFIVSAKVFPRLSGRRRRKPA